MFIDPTDIIFFMGYNIVLLLMPPMSPLEYLDDACKNLITDKISTMMNTPYCFANLYHTANMKDIKNKYASDAELKAKMDVVIPILKNHFASHALDLFLIYK